MASSPRGVPPDGLRPPASTPARPRLLARTRLLAFVLFSGLLVVGGLGGWALASLVDGWPTPLHAVALVSLLGVSAALAWRSTRLVERLFKQEDRLLRSVVHEIRAPLSRLLLALDMGSAKLLPPDQALKEAGIEAVALQELIDDLVEAARIMSGTMARPSEPVRLDEVVPSVAGQVPVAPATIEVDVRSVWLVGSPRLVRLAVVNLVRNAAHHAYAGGPGTIRVQVDQQGIAVLDDGPGIPAARLAELQGDLPRGFRQAGSGLGLALAAWVAEVHGGRLLLENRAGGGFEARLDLSVTEEEPDLVRGPD